MAKGLYAGQAYLHLSEWVLTDTMRVESMSGDMVLHFRTLVPSQPKVCTAVVVVTHWRQSRCLTSRLFSSHSIDDSTDCK